MDSIYEGAVATIVALEGDSETGLPGVKSGSRVVQYSDTVQEQQLIVNMPTLSQHLDKSEWKKRAWTYQEGILSRRCIIFTATEMIFECRSDTHYESISQPTYSQAASREKGNISSTWNGNLLCNPIARQEQWKFSMYAELIREYTKREMSFSSDALNAAQGMLRTFERAGITSFF